MSTKRRLLFEIHYYHDNDPENPDAWPLFRQEQRDFKPEEWGAWCGDSITGAVDAAFCEQQFRVNKTGNSMQWRAGTTDQLEIHFKMRLKGYRCDVVVTAHVEKKYVNVPAFGKGGTEKRIDKRSESGVEDDEGGQIMVRGIAAPGRLARSEGLISQFSEVYRAYGYRDSKNRPRWGLQTELSEEFAAKTQILAPDGCKPDYEELWANFTRKTRPPIRLLVYGIGGTKKSTLAASFIKANRGPVYVAMFDGLGMDEPYLRAGDAMGGEIEEGESDSGVPIKRVWIAK